MPSDEEKWHQLQAKHPERAAAFSALREATGGITPAELRLRFAELVYAMAGPDGPEDVLAELQNARNEYADSLGLSSPSRLPAPGITGWGALLNAVRASRGRTSPDAAERPGGEPAGLTGPTRRTAAPGQGPSALGTVRSQGTNRPGTANGPTGRGPHR